MLLLLPGALSKTQAAWIWVEGEHPVENQMHRHPWWYDQVKRDLFSGGDFISNFDKDRPGEATYRFQAPTAGVYEFWVRANPLMAKLSYALNGGADIAMDLNRDKRGEVNVAADGKPDLRFLAWSKVGQIRLAAGENTIRFRMTSDNNHHGYLDCFVFSNEPFQPQGLLKPDQIAGNSQKAEKTNGWFAFDPTPDSFSENSAIDLRFLNERFAGEQGFIQAKEGHFVHSANQEPLRFWAVNGPPRELAGAELARCARTLAKYGVNMVRVHGGYFDENGKVDPARVRHAIEIVEAMKAEGIYTHFSIYFPLWLDPTADAPYLKGYSGKTHPFAALFFNPDFQSLYREWWTALLTTPNPRTSKPLVEEPAVAGLEMQNEDSLFFWTFSEQNLPEPQLELIEQKFGDWLAKKYGSLANALNKWNGLKLKRDKFEAGRVAFRPLWNMFHEKTPRDQDTAQFLFELQKTFYADTYAFLRKLGFKGVITASNWATASPEVFGPLEKLSYTCGDFIDRHGYFSCNHQGEEAAWSLRTGHTFTDRSALRFDAEQPGKPKLFVHPAMDPHYQGEPSMISETTWNRPNRFRSEAPLYLAGYGALQGSDAIVHFALDGAHWAVKPGYFMQPWTLMTPAMMGQFPAAALLYRKGLIATGKLLAHVTLNKQSLLRLEGTPLPQDAALDELRLKDLPVAQSRGGGRIDPLIHYAGRVEVGFSDSETSTEVSDLKDFINHATQQVHSSTGEMNLDYGKGVLTINAPQAQGASGCLRLAGTIETRDLTISSDLDLGHIIAVALDQRPLASSDRILLQVMSEEKPTDFQTEPAGDGLKRVTNIGTDPWQVKELQGSVAFKRRDAAKLKWTALDFNGYAETNLGTGREIKLRPKTIYYLIEPNQR